MEGLKNEKKSIGIPSIYFTRNSLIFFLLWCICLILIPYLPYFIYSSRIHFLQNMSIYYPMIWGYENEHKHIRMKICIQLLYPFILMNFFLKVLYTLETKTAFLSQGGPKGNMFIWPNIPEIKNLFNFLINFFLLKFRIFKLTGFLHKVFAYSFF